MYTAIQKARSKKGFTLMEMLIVVAIIAVLVAIAIPVVTAQLEKARVAADQANIRSAVALASIEYLNEDAAPGGYYLANGTFAATKTGDLYKLQATAVETPYATASGAKGQVFKVDISSGTPVVTFEAAQ